MKKLIIRTTAVLSIAVSLIFISCKKETSEIIPTEPVQIDLTANQISLIASENTFAFDIFKKIIENTSESKNIIISPLSISTALSMALNGANGTTSEGMSDALRMSGVSPDVINKSSKALREALLSVDKRVLISIANSVWSENNFVVKKPFTDILTEYYAAESKSFDINDPLVPGLINTWIGDKTNGLIKHMIDELEDNTKMLLINAIYFKGKWASQFDKDNTLPGAFNKTDGSTIQVPMMKQHSGYKIYKGEGFTLAELPYGQGNFVMDVFLPDVKDGLKAILPLINENNIKGWLPLMDEKKIDIFFPRFKYAFDLQLNKILSDMGMGIAFTDYADFSNISDIGLLINTILHKAFIETNEEGTEAAAVTIIGYGATSVTTDVLSLDHPFLYVIRETTTNSILFMGRVTDPLAEE